jgi:MYXO-CTERM domain-containing protein
MVTGQFNAYTWWYIKRSYGPINSGAVTKRGWCMAQFSKFIRPGFYRVDATATPTSGVSLSAYKSDTDVVLVAVNTSSSTQSITVAINGSTIASYDKFTTSGAKDMASDGKITASNGSLNVPLDGSSVTTLHGTGTITSAGGSTGSGGSPDAGGAKDGGGGDGGLDGKGNGGSDAVIPGSGGAQTIGGNSGSGGAQGSGGTVGSGSGGTSAKGGSTGSGGDSAKGGSGAESSGGTLGGVSAAQGGNSAGAGASSGGGTANGCSCTVGARAARSTFPMVALLLVALGLNFRRHCHGQRKGDVGSRHHR